MRRHDRMMGSDRDQSYRPHHSVMAAHDFNRLQAIFMSFRVILSNTTSLSSFPCEDTRVQGSANARHMPAMIAHLTWMIYLGQLMRMRSSCTSTANNETGENAFTLIL